MRDRIIHTLLALMILTQSVSVLAFVPSMHGQAQQDVSSTVSDSPMVTVEKSHHGEGSSCHQKVASPEADALKSCCDTMDQASCIIHCSAIAAAVCYSVAVDGIDIHERFPVVTGYFELQSLPTELFRPPQIS